MGEIGSMMKPKFKWCGTGGEGGMRDSLFDMGGNEHGEGPKEVMKVCIN